MKKLEIFRIEHPLTGEGPFYHYDKDDHPEINVDDSKFWTVHREAGPKIPSWQYDGIRIFATPEHKSYFTSIQALKQTFGKLLPMLLEDGFNIYRLRVDESEVIESFSGLQVAFKPKNRGLLLPEGRAA